MIKKLLLLAFVAVSATCGLSAAKYKSSVELLKGEKWWGGSLVTNGATPIDKAFASTEVGKGGYNIPMFVSSRGRYIWSSKPFAIEFTGQEFKIESDFEEIKAGSGGRTLREAYLVCCHKNFPPKDKLPSMELFRKPLYDTRGVLPPGFSGSELLDYAHRISNAGYPAGIIILGSDWQSYNGSLGFSAELSTKPSDLMAQLHRMGFKVMVEVSPLVTPDNGAFRLAREKGLLLMTPQGKPRIIEWQGGYSACYDLTNPEVLATMKSQLNSLHKDTGVDGFVFDIDGADDYMAESKGGADQFVQAWRSLGSDFDLCQYKIMSGSNFLSPCISGIDNNEAFGWGFVRHNLSEIILANLLAHPYTSVSSSVMPHDTVSNELMLRYVQFLCATPVMHITSEPWTVADPKYVARIKEAFSFREVMGGYISGLLAERGHIAEPIIRHMEYAFPRNGFTDCNDQFMVGSKYLVAPLLDDSGKRLVRFPRGVWVDRNGKRYRGPLVTEVDCRGGMIPCFEISK